MIAKFVKNRILQEAFNDRHANEDSHELEQYIKDGPKRVPYILVERLNNDIEKSDVTHIVNILFSHGNFENLKLIAGGLECIANILDTQLNAPFRDGFSKSLIAIRIMAWEYPAYGNNKTELSETNIERQANLALSTLQESTWGTFNKETYHDRIITVSWGFSIGSVPACMCSKWTAPYVDIVLLEAPLRSALSSTGHKMLGTIVTDVFDTIEDLLMRDKNYSDSVCNFILDVSPKLELKQQVYRQPKLLCIFAENDMEVPHAYSEFLNQHNHKPFADRIELIPDVSHKYFLTPAGIERDTVLLGNEILCLLSVPVNAGGIPLDQFAIDCDRPLSASNDDISTNIQEEQFAELPEFTFQASIARTLGARSVRTEEDLDEVASAFNDSIYPDLDDDAEKQLSSVGSETGSLFPGTSVLMKSKQRVARDIHEASNKLSESSIVLRLLNDNE